MASLISRLAGRQESRQKARQTDRHMYRKDRVQKDKKRKTDEKTYLYIFVQAYIYSMETHRHTDGQTNRRTDRQILYI